MPSRRASGPQMPSFPLTLDAQPTHPSSRVLQHRQSGGNSYVYSCRNASSTSNSFHHVTAQPGLLRIQHHQQRHHQHHRPKFHPSRIYNSHHRQVPSAPGPTRTPPPDKCPPKKGVPPSGSNPPLPPDRKHLYPTHAPVAAVPCRSPRPTSNQPHLFSLSHARRDVSQERRGVESARLPLGVHACLQLPRGIS